MVVLEIDRIPRNVGAEYITNRLLLSGIPNLNVGVPASRDKLIGVVRDMFYGEDSVGMVAVLVIRGGATVDALG